MHHKMWQSIRRLIMPHRSRVAHDQLRTIIHPPEIAFDLPGLATTRPGFDQARAFWPAPPAVLNGRNGRLNAPTAQPLAKLKAIVSSVYHELLRVYTRAATGLRDTHARQSDTCRLALVKLALCT